MGIEVVNGYEDGRGSVVLLGRENGKRTTRRVPAEYVTYLHASEVTDATERQLRASAHVRSIAVEGEWLRVGWRDDQVRRFMCQDKASPLLDWGIRTYEGDVDATTRYVVDSGVEVGVARAAYLDIETDSRVPFSRKEEMRILSWAVIDETGSATCAVLEEDGDGAERDLLGAMFEALEPYDQMVAWSGDGFDFPVIEARAEERSLRVDMRRWLKLDHLVLFRRMNMHGAESGEEKQSMKLQSIAMATIGDGKDDFNAAQTYEAWAAGGAERARLLKYNVKDTDLLRRIEDKTGYIKLFGTLCQACRVFGDSRGLNPTRQMDGFLLRLGKDRGHHFPTRQFREDVGQFKGAYVMEPKAKGIERDVHVCDFASLYPSIIITWNMSPDTLTPVPVNGPLPPGVCRSPLTGAGFTTQRMGILPAALGELLRLRKEWNNKKSAEPPGTPAWYDADRRSTAYKVAANSFYGVIGAPFSRYYDKQVAESVTQCGVWLLKETIGEAMKKGWRVIYADTDSAFVQGCTRDEFTEFVDACNTTFYPRRLREQGCAENTIKLAYEKQFDRIVFTGAKRYAGNYVHYKGKAATADSKPEVKGLEFKRGDTAFLARELQEHAIHMLMGGCEDIEKFNLLIANARDRILLEYLPVEHVQLSKALTKGIKEYAQKKKNDGTDAAQSPHVVVAKILLARGLEVREGTRIEYVVIDGSDSPAKVMPAIDYTGTEADRYYVWESMVYPPTQRLLEAAFVDSDWKSWADVRPRKVRVSKAKAAAGQGGLFAAPAAPIEAGPPQPIVVRLREGATSPVAAVRAVLARYPGNRPVRLVVALVGGAEAELATPLRVDGSTLLFQELARLGAA